VPAGYGRAAFVAGASRVVFHLAGSVACHGQSWGRRMIPAPRLCARKEVATFDALDAGGVLVRRPGLGVPLAHCAGL
jgi:hypothetical protein